MGINGTEAPDGVPRIPDHQLIRKIGEGSYGSVWLASNAIGTFRAVKIVERSRFDRETPYEREYKGLQKFEPYSREHEGLVDILQLGRDDQAGFFYYVMEAADDVVQGTAINPETYEPRTLATDLSARHNLPVSECLEISCALADALAFLHNSGLVHRDLKPSNIVFVNGKPKIADVGLVTDEGAKSYLGSTGYIPPEGVGKREADIYSLGIVMYEMVTGKSPRDFPELPSFFQDAPDQKQLIGLNEIISKASDPDWRRRYRSATEINAELSLVKHGRSLALLRFVRRWRVAAALLLLLVIVTGGYMSALKLRLSKEVPLPPLERPPQAALPSDWFGTGLTDLLFPSEQSLRIVSEQEPTPPPVPLDFPGSRQLRVLRAENVDDRVGDEAFVSGARAEGANTNYPTPSRAFLSIIEQTGCILKTFECEGTAFKHHQFGVSASELQPLRICQLEQGGPRVLLASVSSPWSKRPRGLWCFDFESRQPKWFFETAGFVSRIDLLDCDADGKQEILLGTSAPNNGNTITNHTLRRDFDDSHSTLFLVSHEGAPLEAWTVGPDYSRIEPVPLGAPLGPGRELIAILSEGKYNGSTVQRPKGSILAFTRGSPSSRMVYDIGGHLLSCATADLNDDKHAEILLTDSEGCFHVLDSSLKSLIIRKIAPAMAPPTSKSFVTVLLKIAGVGPLEPGGPDRVVLTAAQNEERDGDPLSTGSDRSKHPILFFHDETVLVLDGEARLVASHKLGAMRAGNVGLQLTAYLGKTPRGPEIIAVSDRVTYLRLSRW